MTANMRHRFRQPSAPVSDAEINSADNDFIEFPISAIPSPQESVLEEEQKVFLLTG